MDLSSLNVDSKLIKFDNDKECILYYIKIGDNLIATVVIDKDPDINGMYELHIICVNEEYKNKGIGRFLLEYVRDIHKEIYLTSIHGSENFFIKCGFTPFYQVIATTFISTQRPTTISPDFYYNKSVKGL